MSNPLVSIIVPVYNGEKYVRECIESILKQTYKNIELIIVDDGSADSTLDITKDLSKTDKRMAVFSKKNAGVSAARNFGLEKAKGELIFFVDSDDTLSSECIEYYVSLLLENDADIAIVPMPNKFTGKAENINLEEAKDNKRVVSGKDAAKMMLYYKIVISSWGKLFSKKLIDGNKIMFDEKLAYGEGFLFSIRCLLAAKKVAIGERKVYNYRLDNANSVMTSYKRRLVDDSIESQKKIRALIEQNNKELIRASNYAMWHTNCDCLNTVLGSNAGEKKLVRKLKKSTRRHVLSNVFLPIPVADKCKSIMFFVSPGIASGIINSKRKRKFTKVK